MLSNLAFSKVHPWNAESPSPEKKSPCRHRRVHSNSNSILTLSYSHNSQLQLRPTVARARICKQAKPCYVNERDDEETVSVLSDDEGLILDTRFEYDDNENENSGRPSCSYDSKSLRQQHQQHYMGGNYFFRESSGVAKNDCHDVVVSFPLKGQVDLHHYSNETKENSSSSSPPLSCPDAINTEASIDEDDDEDLRYLVETLRKEKSALSQKCLELEGLVSDVRQDHNCYKAKMTMVMGRLRIQMESERDDNAYLQDKCNNLEKELQALRTGSHKT